MTRKPPCVPPVNKHTLMPHALPYRVMAALKDMGRATRRDLQELFPDTPALTLRNALDSLRKADRIFLVGWERGSGTRCLAVYAAERGGHKAPAPLPPIPAKERQIKHLQAKRLRAASVFEWRGQVQMGDRG
jgi:hypothetical protein